MATVLHCNKRMLQWEDLAVNNVQNLYNLEQIWKYEILCCLKCVWSEIFPLWDDNFPFILWKLQWSPKELNYKITNCLELHWIYLNNLPQTLVPQVCTLFCKYHKTSMCVNYFGGSGLQGSGPLKHIRKAFPDPLPTSKSMFVLPPWFPRKSEASCKSFRKVSKFHSWCEILLNWSIITWPKVNRH